MRMFVAGLLFVSFSVPAFAAIVTPMAGEVKVNTGDGFHTINSAQEFPAGTRVMAGPNTTAAITYSDRCRFKLRPGSVFLIEKDPPCKAFDPPWHFGFQTLNTQSQPASTDVSFAPKVSDPGDGRTKGNRAVDNWDYRFDDHYYLMLGGAALAGAGVAALLLSGDSGKPASP